MTFITIMLVSLTSGDQFALGFSSQRACSEALLRIPEVAAEMHVELDAATCVETIAPGTSPRPKPRPEAI